MNLRTVSNKRDMSYGCYIEQRMQMVELKLNMIIDENPQLINALDRIVNHPLVRKYGYIPFPNFFKSYF